MSPSSIIVSKWRADEQMDIDDVSAPCDVAEAHGHVAEVPCDVAEALCARR
jgi:hypothetical protein